MARSTYDEIVSRNFAHMDTQPADWRSVPFELKTDATGAIGPAQEIPAGYSPAPSIIEDTPGIESCPCLLCGHQIKNPYYIVHDTNRWHLRVGSECVTHFGERSGAQLASDAEMDAAQRLLAAVDAGTTHNRTLHYTDHRRLCAIRGKGALETPGAIRGWFRLRRPEIPALIERLRVSATQRMHEYERNTARQVADALAQAIETTPAPAPA